MRPRFALAAQFGWVISGLGHKSLSSVIRPRRREQQQREQQQHPLSLLVRQRSVASFSQRERENGRMGERGREGNWHTHGLSEQHVHLPGSQKVHHRKQQREQQWQE